MVHRRCVVSVGHEWLHLDVDVDDDDRGLGDEPAEVVDNLPDDGP